MKLLLENWRKYVNEGTNTYTAKDAQNEAEMHQGSNKPYDVDAVDLIWRYEPRYNVSDLLRLMPGGTIEDWQAWLQQEAEFRAENGDEDWLNRFTKWWLSDPTQEPVIAIEDQQGKAEGIWDGWHRCAVSIISGHQNIPVFVGRRRQNETPT